VGDEGVEIDFEMGLLGRKPVVDEGSTREAPGLGGWFE